MKCVRRWQSSLAGRHQAALWRNSWPAELEKGKFLTRKTTKENHLAKDTRRKAKTTVVTLEDNHSLKHLKIILVKRQMIKIASLRMKCAPSCFTAALHIVQSLLPQIVTHPWKYYCTMIDRVSIFEMSKFCFSQGLQNWQHEHLQLILLFGYNLLQVCIYFVLADILEKIIFCYYEGVSVCFVRAYTACVLC